MSNGIKTIIFIIVISIFFMMYQIKSVTPIFGELYDLEDNAIFNSISIIGYSELVNTKDNVSRNHKDFEVTNENFRAFYDYIINFEVKKVKPQKIVEFENLETYSLGINMKIDDGYYHINLDIGKNYLIVSTSADYNIMMYKHDLEAKEYQDVIDKLVECLN